MTYAYQGGHFPQSFIIHNECLRLLGESIGEESCWPTMKQYGEFLNVLIFPTFLFPLQKVLSLRENERKLRILVYFIQSLILKSHWGLESLTLRIYLSWVSLMRNGWSNLVSSFLTRSNVDLNVIWSGIRSCLGFMIKKSYEKLHSI